MKKVICIKDGLFLNAFGIIKGNIYDVTKEDKLLWTINTGTNKITNIKSHNEFILLSELRKLKLEKICNCAKNI